MTVRVVKSPFSVKKSPIRTSRSRIVIANVLRRDREGDLPVLHHDRRRRRVERRRVDLQDHGRLRLERGAGRRDRERALQLAGDPTGRAAGTGRIEHEGAGAVGERQATVDRVHERHADVQHADARELGRALGDRLELEVARDLEVVDLDGDVVAGELEVRPLLQVQRDRLAGLVDRVVVVVVDAVLVDDEDLVDRLVGVVDADHQVAGEVEALVRRHRTRPAP